MKENKSQNNEQLTQQQPIGAKKPKSPENIRQEDIPSTPG